MGWLIFFGVWVAIILVVALVLWLLVRIAKATVAPGADFQEGGIQLSVILGCLVFVVLWGVVVINSAAQNAYAIAYVAKAEKVCQTTVDYSFEVEPNLHVFPGEMPVRWVMATTVQNLRNLARYDATVTHTGNKTECDRLLNTNGRSGESAYYLNNRNKQGFRLF